MANLDQLKESLAGIVGDKWVSALKTYLNVRPKTSDEISRIMKTANDTKTPVTPRGGGTSWWGGDKPRDGGIRLDMTRMDELLTIDEDAMTVTVESGITFTKLESKLKDKGYRIRIVPESGGVATMGGHIGTWGTSPRSSGFFEDQDTQIVGLKVVLPTGEIVQTGSGAVSTAAGNFARRFFPSDLTGLFVGGDGGFGVITEAALKLHRLPEVIITNMIGYEDLGACIMTLRKIQESQRSGSLSTIVEQMLYSQETIVSLIPRLEARLVGASQVLTITGDGDADDVHRHLFKVRELALKEHGKIIADHVPEWWEGRFKFIMGHDSHVGGPRVMLVSMIPFSKYVEASAIVERLGREQGRSIFNAGYPLAGVMLGHAVIPCEDSTAEARNRALSLGRKILEAQMNIGCVPHRIGTDFLPTLTKKLDPSYLELIKRIKQALDPNKIMNPDVVLPS